MAKKQPLRYFYVLFRSTNLGGRRYYTRRFEFGLFGPYTVRNKTEALRFAKEEFAIRFPEGSRMASKQTYVALTTEPPIHTPAEAIATNQRLRRGEYLASECTVTTDQNAFAEPLTGHVYFGDAQNETPPDPYGPTTGLIVSADLKKLFLQNLSERIPPDATPDFHLLNGHTITLIKSARQ